MEKPSADRTILFFLRCYPNIGGIEQVTTLLANALSKKQNVRILAMEKQIERQPHLCPSIIVDQLPSGLSQKELITRYNHYLSSNHIDIVINQGAYQDFTPIILNPDRPETKVISVLHGMPMHEYSGFIQEKRLRTLSKKRGLARIFSLWKIDNGLVRRKKKIISNAQNNHQQLAFQSDAVVLLSEGYKQEYLHKYKIDSVHRLEVIGNPVIRSESSSVILEEKEKIVLYVGRLSNFDKRVDRLLRIWSNIETSIPEWQLILMGDGPDRNSLEEQAQKSGLRRVTFCGFGDPKSLYRKASIVCLTSQMECLPMSLIEAQQWGCIPMAFGCSKGISDITEDGNAGVIVPPFDEKEYSLQLIRLMQDKERRQELGNRAFKSSERFDITKISQSWQNLIDSIPDRSGNINSQDI